MSIAFTYRILRYVHDPAADETLNVVVIMYAPKAVYLASRLDTRYERLTKTFAGFNGDNFRQILRRFELAVERYRGAHLDSLPLLPSAKSVDEIVSQIWPDKELSFRFGPTLAGITDSPEDELEAIFERMVQSQYPREDKQRRTDDDVWTVYKQPLIAKAVTSVLRPKTISTKDFSIDFEYAFSNENWHVLQPLSLDLSRPDAIQRKAAQWLGNGSALEDSKELSTLYLLLGEPQLKAHKAAYEKAKSILNKIPLRHEIVEEKEASTFANQIKNYMKQHTVIPPD